jgi:hypothetical protein
MKYLSGLLFLVGVPFVCIFLISIVRKSKKKYKGLGIGLFIFGVLVTFLTLLTYIPTILLSFTNEDLSTTDEVFGFFVWFIPGLFITYTGWQLTKKREIEKEES